MPIPVRGVLFPAGTGGAPSTANPQRIPALDRYEHTIVNEGGFESAELAFRVPTRAAADAYLSLLMAGVVMSGPRGGTVWEGFVSEVAIDLGNETIARSLTDLANRVVVRYKDASGQQASAPAATDAASITRYGTKTRLMNLSTASASAAASRAAVVLAKRKDPTTKRALKSATGAHGVGYAVTVTCRGWWDTLGWLLTSSTSTTLTQTSAQVLALLTAYCATNAFFSLSTVNLVATGVSDVETIEDDSTYQEVIATKLASGSGGQSVVYGVYEGRALTIRPWAGATPSVVAYQQRRGEATVRDSAGNVVDPWDVRPDTLVRMPSMQSGAAADADTFYCKRVRLSLSRDSAELTLEPDEPEGVAEILTQPAGAGSTGTSARQAAVERTIARQAATRFSGTNGNVDLGGGSIKDGKVSFGAGGAGGTIDTGGGTITNTGGGAVDVGSGAGIGSSGSLDETIDDRVAALLQAGAGITLTYNDPANTLTIAAAATGAPVGARYWVGAADAALTTETDMSVLGSGLLKQTVASGIATPALAVAGTDYVAPGTLSESIDDRVAALLAAGSGITLSYNDAGNTLTIAADASAPPDARYWVATANATLTNETNLGALGSGLLKQSVASGIATPAIAVAGTDYAAASHTHTSGQITDFGEAVDDEVAGLLTAGNLISLTYNDTAGTLTIAVASLNETIDDRVAALLVAGSGISITYNDAGNTLTIAASGGLSGSGTTEQLAYWSSASALGDAPIYYDVSTNRIGVKDSTPSYDLDVNATIRATSGISAGSPATIAAGGQMRAQGRIQTDEFFESAAGYQWDLGSYVAGGTITPATGRVSISINGTTYFLLARTS